MPLPLNDDLTIILGLEDFGTSITYRRKNALGDSIILGIFDNETVPTDAGGFVAVHEEQPRLTCRTVDIPYIAETDEMIIGATTYKVRAWVHDGTGVTTVQLERQ
jgi:hypothetical protein